jgi:sugar/nucleoside kinase (ribokinase family)
MNLLIVGSVALDSVKTPFGQQDRALGGSATYASVAASYFARPGIVAVVGGDFPRRHLKMLLGRGVDLDGLQVIPGGRTFYWSGSYEGNMNQAITHETQLNVFESFNPAIPRVYRRAPYVLLGNIHPSLQLEVLDQMKKPRLVLCDTMNYWIESEPKLLEKVFKRVDVICINDGEAMLYCGTSSLPKAAAQLMRLGPKRIIIKKGIHGVHLYGKDSFFALPAMPLTRVKDPTGAGDSFAGGTLGRLAQAGRLNENAFRRAVAMGTVMASYCVEDFSCRRTAKLSDKDINSRLDRLKEYTRLP